MQIVILSAQKSEKIYIKQKNVAWNSESVDSFAVVAADGAAQWRPNSRRR